MPTGPFSRAASELDLVRREYESSLSWRVTRPLRALARGARAVRSRAVGCSSETERAWAPPAGFTPGWYDSWLEHFNGERLELIDAACEDRGPESFALFRDLDLDLWALLLTQEYELYPNIRAVLPDVPDPSLQQLW